MCINKVQQRNELNIFKEIRTVHRFLLSHVADILLNISTRLIYLNIYKRKGKIKELSLENGEVGVP